MLIRLQTEEQTRQAGYALGRVLALGDFVGLVGNLGCGKTVFCQSVCRGAGVDIATRITSPTFTLMNEYPITVNARAGYIVHCDWYRIEDKNELYGLGMDELVFAEDRIFLVEWAGKFALRTPSSMTVSWEILEDNARQITVTAQPGAGEELMQRWSKSCALLG